MRAKDWKEISVRDPLPLERALGIVWCVQNDTFRFRVEMKDVPLTRRGILSTICSIYDPLGFAAPVILRGKAILQELCRKGVEWDDPVPDELRSRWILWRSSIKELESLEVTRCLKPRKEEKIKALELHYFSDASQTGYGVAVYLRVVYENIAPHVTFVLGKARVTPLNRKITIP
ncbi:uncharacterized protein LOC117115625 [Anneissia japonica]|uniref:uncharacterized protein LOC117115625 n=1 Tax=Anneissia japonica TaxID=1529436 RepID=UPI0014254BEA|nr:uncharacterized protein LOC117115625 [Anneissia japonica]